jgi:hypothetical protein
MTSTKTYYIKPSKKKFETLCYKDGMFVTSFTSKNKRAAHRKGEEYIEGIRTGINVFRTEYGELLDAIKAWNDREDFLDKMYGGRYGHFG